MTLAVGLAGARRPLCRPGGLPAHRVGGAARLCHRALCRPDAPRASRPGSVGDHCRSSSRSASSSRLGGIIGLQIAGLASDLPALSVDGSAEDRVAARGNARAHPRTAEEYGPADRAGDEGSTALGGEAAPTPPVTPEQRPLPVEVHERDATPLEVARSVLSPLLEPLATHRHRLRRPDLHPPAAGGPARPDDPAVRVERPAPHDGGDGRRCAAPQPLLPDAARAQRRLRRRHRRGASGSIGVPSPLLWGIFAALMRFVPYIGSFIAGAMPIALAAAVDPSGWSLALMTLALFLVAEPVMGHVIEPLVYGQSTGLSPFAVVMSAIFWTWLWGPVGLRPRDPRDPLPRRPRPACRTPRIPRRASRRPAGADAVREPLSAHAGRRSRRGARIGRAAPQGALADLLLRRGRDGGAAARGEATRRAAC